MKTTRIASKSSDRSTKTAGAVVPAMRAVSDLMADALAANAALTAEQRAMFNAIHDALSGAVALANGSTAEHATRAIRDASERAHAAACGVLVANRRR